MNQPLISVIIPVYNAEAYIERCIGSVQDNDYSNLEIICVNDGSTDSSLSVLHHIAAKDPRIRIIDKPNGGVSTARNAGLDVATGEYVAFIDSDDWIHSLYFSMLMKTAQMNNAQIAIAHYREMYENDISTIHEPVSYPETVSTEYAGTAMLRDGYIRRSVWGRIYNRETIGNIRFPEGIQFGEDMIFNVLVGDSSSCRISYFNLALYFYYQLRSTSLVHTKNLDANYDLGSWYIDHIDCFQNKDIAIFASFSALLSYRYEGSFSPEAKAIRTKADKKLRKCLRVLLHEIDCSAITKIKYYAFSLSHTLYRIILHITDPSVKHYEKILKQRYTHSEQ